MSFNLLLQRTASPPAERERCTKPMRFRHTVVGLLLGCIVAVVGTSCTFEYAAQRRSTELRGKVKRSAPVGASRAEVEAALRSEGLPFTYSPSENALFGPWIPVGRYRLLWETQFYYQVSLDQSGRVTGFATQLFNEGI